MRCRPRFPLRRLAASGAVGVVVLVPIAAPSSAATHGEKYCEEKLRDAPPGSVCEDLGNGNIRFRRGTVEPAADDNDPVTPTVDVAAPSPDRTVDTSPGNEGLVALAFVAGAVGIGSAARRRSRSDSGPPDGTTHTERAASAAAPHSVTREDNAAAHRRDHTTPVPVATVVTGADADENDDERWKPPAP